MIRVPFSLLFTALSALLILGGCAATEATQSTPEPPAAEGQEETDDHSQHELEMAQLALAIAQIEVQVSSNKANLAVAQARSKLDEAKLDLGHFETVQKARRLTEAQLSLDRAGYRAEEAEAELGELEAMYAEEEFAATTKELVIRRGRVQRDFSRRSLELSEQSLELLANVALPKELRQLQRAVRDAEAGLAEAQADLQKTDAQNKKKVLEARHAVAKLEQGAEEGE